MKKTTAGQNTVVFYLLDHNLMNRLCCHIVSHLVLSVLLQVMATWLAEPVSCQVVLCSCTDLSVHWTEAAEAVVVLEVELFSVKMIN